MNEEECRPLAERLQRHERLEPRFPTSLGEQRREIPHGRCLEDGRDRDASLQIRRQLGGELDRQQRVSAYFKKIVLDGDV